MQYQAEPEGYDRITTFDIETTHFNPEKGETVAIGVGVHTPNDPETAASFETFLRESRADEGELVERAFRHIDRLDPDALVSYNGLEFDMEFLWERAAQLDTTLNLPEVHVNGPHIDLFADRKAASDPDTKWPSLEECLASYDYPVTETLWNGSPVTNTRFGEELAPAWLEACMGTDDTAIDTLRDLLDHYLITDLEANLAIYYADRNIEYRPIFLGRDASFET